ncbi:MAG: DUF2807 domain-containing protein [bacterium]|nr:DUF2807 domain-containing protein [bacterium]
MEPSDSLIFEVSLRGKPTQLDEINVRQNGQRVMIESSRQSSNISISGSNISIGGAIIGGSISINGMVIGGGRGVTIIGGGSSEPDVTITVSVPIGTKIIADGDWHSLIVGNTNGDLSINNSGNGGVTAGTVKNVEVDIHSSASAAIQEVNGDASIHIHGSGDVDVNGGNISQLNVSIHGSGDVKISAEAKNARLSIHGSGKIYVRSVLNRPEKTVRGSGTAIVGNWKH